MIRINVTRSELHVIARGPSAQVSPARIRTYLCIQVVTGTVSDLSWPTTYETNNNSYVAKHDIHHDQTILYFSCTTKKIMIAQKLRNNEQISFSLGNTMKGVPFDLRGP